MEPIPPDFSAHENLYILVFNCDREIIQWPGCRRSCYLPLEVESRGMTGALEKMSCRIPGNNTTQMGAPGGQSNKFTALQSRQVKPTLPERYNGPGGVITCFADLND